LIEEEADNARCTFVAVLTVRWATIRTGDRPRLSGHRHRAVVPSSAV